MIVVSDTSPINYLLLVGQIDLLPRLFQQIIIPDVVRDEMLDPGAPLVLRQWIANPPSWLTIQTVSVIDETLSSLDPGEQAAITLAQTLPADLLIIDERLGRQSASNRGIPVIGTLGILDDAADRGQATDLVAYLAAPENQDLGVVKAQRRKRLKPPQDLSPFPLPKVLTSATFA
jgi:predicted nucleic acid-binding protein